MLHTLDGPAVRRWSVAAADALAAHREEIDAINVFPVPDRDTGTNLVLTLRAASDAFDTDSTENAARALEVMARGAVLGARGNAGVIVSQILRGLAEGVGEPDEYGRVDGQCDGPRLQHALRAAVRRAYAAVAEPLEGTILSVARAAADAAQSVREASNALSTVITVALGGAADALRHTPEQLPVLARAGVVDAGGRGLVVLLDALATIITGRAQSSEPSAHPSDLAVLRLANAESGAHAYEVQYLLTASERAISQLRDRLCAIGDSVVTAGTGTDEWAVHVHVDDVGPAIEAGLDVGRPRQIVVTRFGDDLRLQSGVVAALDRGGVPANPRMPGAVGVVGLAPGTGLSHLFRAEGAQVVGDDSTVPPAPADVLDAVLSTGAKSVIVLPNSSALFDIAEAVAGKARSVGVEVAVIPTRSVVQGVAALAVHDPDRSFSEDVIAMVEAAAATRWAEITVADREALTSVGRCQPGNVLGLILGEVVEIGDSIEAVARGVLDRLLGSGGELVTVVASDTGRPAIEMINEHLHRSQPLVEMTVYDAGQSRVPLLIGVE